MLRTTSKYWDCECSDDAEYIHPASESYCLACGAKKEDQPDSRIDEVVKNTLINSIKAEMDVKDAYAQNMYNNGILVGFRLTIILGDRSRIQMDVEML